MKRLVFIIVAALLLSCDRNDEAPPSEIFEVTTWGISRDCKLVVIDFQESDRLRIEGLSGSTGIKYEGLNLDVNKFGQSGKKLRVRLRKTFDSESFACTTQYPSFPWVTVLHAEIID